MYNLVVIIRRLIFLYKLKNRLTQFYKILLIFYLSSFIASDCKLYDFRFTTHFVVQYFRFVFVLSLSRDRRQWKHVFVRQISRLHLGVRCCLSLQWLARRRRMPWWRYKVPSVPEGKVRILCACVLHRLLARSLRRDHMHWIIEYVIFAVSFYRFEYHYRVTVSALINMEMRSIDPLSESSTVCSFPCAFVLFGFELLECAVLMIT